MALIRRRKTGCDSISQLKPTVIAAHFRMRRPGMLEPPREQRRTSGGADGQIIADHRGSADYRETSSAGPPLLIVNPGRYFFFKGEGSLGHTEIGRASCRERV